MSEAGKTAFVFPGQGSQYVGMGKDLYDTCPAARQIFDEADSVLGFPLSGLCFEGPEDELKQTINAQPALVTVSLACLKAAQAELGSAFYSPSFVAGHSLGEYTALAAAGVVDFKTAVYLARERGRLMQEAGNRTTGSMAAIIGADEAVIEEICKKTDVTLANINCPGQLVISGAVENLEKAKQMATEQGIKRVMPLAVSGAFHSPLMTTAKEGMATVLESVELQDAAVPIIANTTAEPITSAGQIRRELLEQFCNSVQWQRSVQYMIEDGTTTFIEFGPGKVLTGLIKRIERKATLINVGDVESINSLRA